MTARPTGRPTMVQNSIPAAGNYDVSPSINNSNMQMFNEVATCGGGKVGNGLCYKVKDCCSIFGFCGTSDSHCSNRAPVAGSASNTNYNSNGGAVQSTVVESSIKGTCGGGSVGNNICPNNSDCCSQYGFCGTTLQHCVGKQGQGGVAVTTNNNNDNVAAAGTAGGNIPVQQPQQQQQQYGATTTSANNNNNFGGPTVVTHNNIEYGGGHPEQPSMNIQSNTLPHGTNKKIIGYYAGWQWYDRNKLADPINIDFRKMQRVNYAFFQFDKQGELYGIDRWGDPQVLFGPYSSMLGGGVQKCSYDGPYDVNCGYHEHNTGLIYRAHQVGTEVFPSIGGWTLSDNFPSVSANPTAREKFAENCIKILRYYDFDGVSGSCLCIAVLITMLVYFAAFAP